MVVKTPEVVPVDDPRAIEFWDARKKRDAYWAAMHSMRQEYLAEHKGQYDLTARRTRHWHWRTRKAQPIALGLGCW